MAIYSPQQNNIKFSPKHKQPLIIENYKLNRKSSNNNNEPQNIISSHYGAEVSSITLNFVFGSFVSVNDDNVGAGSGSEYWWCLTDCLVDWLFGLVLNFG